MRPGDIVVCVKEKEERSRPLLTPIKLDKRYEILATRDAGLTPPVDPDHPHEVKIVPGDTEVDKLGWWYQSYYFSKIS